MPIISLLVKFRCHILTDHFINLCVFSGTSTDSKKRFEKRTAEWVNSTMSITISDGEQEDHIDVGESA